MTDHSQEEVLFLRVLYLKGAFHADLVMRMFQS